MANRFGDDLVAATERAERWAIFDPDPKTRGQVDALVDAGDPALIRLFDGRLSFGTAGLRAPVGVGPNRMNALVVRQTTAAVVDWLKQSGVPEPRVLIGFDARHDSPAFAANSSAAVQASGGVALLSDAAAPTPVFAHALLAESADAAVVITASHNPAADNGYKLYLGDGLQLVAPADAEIAAIIDTLAADWHERGSAIDDVYASRDDGGRYSAQAWIDDHVASATEALFTSNRQVSIAYTAMHGVGGLPIVQTFRAAGFADPLIVEDQFDPDGDFPTVPFPNPEEPGASDLLLELAQAESVDAALANDPDADRLAMAVPDRDGPGFVALSGNELGALLADHVLRHTSGDDRIVGRSVVSSRLLDAMAAAAGVATGVTLTGFKWVARPIIEQPDKRFVFGFEEAIGYCVGDRVRDKDGVTAAVVAAEMVATLKAAGLTIWDRLDELAADHGLHLNHPISIRFDDDPSRVGVLMEQVAANPPETLGDAAVTAVGPVGLGSLPPSTGLHLLTADGTQVIVRPSGTEPKIKAYIEVIETVETEPGTAASTSVAFARAAAQIRLDAVITDVQALLS